MHILLVHNEYGRKAPSGESVVFRQESQLLARHANRVTHFVVSNDILDQASFFEYARVGVRAVWSAPMYDSMTSV